MAKLFNRAKMTTSTTGSGTVTLSSAANGFQSFADAGVSDGDVIQYVIEEGSAWEIGTGTYSATGTSLTRSPSESSNSGAAISLGGTAKVSITTVAADLNRLQNAGSDIVTVSASGAAVTGNITVTGTVDGVDIATRDGVLTSTTTTANAALPKAGGTLTGAITGTSATFSGDLTVDTDTLYVDSTNNRIGIRTNSPSETLHINSGTRNNGLFIESTDANSNLIFRDNSSTANVSLGCVGNDFRIQNAGSENLRVDASGNVLVGTTDALPADATDTAGISLRPEGRIDVSRDGGQACIFNRMTSDGTIAQFRKDGSTVGSIGVQSSNLWVGTDDTGIRFGAGSETIHAFNPSTNSGRDAAIDIGNSTYRFKDGYFSGTVNAANFNSTSDATLKTNVKTLTGSLDAVKALRGVSFDWIENGNSEVGVIAQEVEAVIPELVSTNDEGIKSVKYGNIVAVLIEAVKELKNEIEELKR